MNYFISFNKKVFTNNLDDYSIDSSLNSKEIYFKGNLKSPKIPCIVRKLPLAYYDRSLLENENDIDKRIDHPNIIPIICSFVQTDFLYTIFPLATYGSIDAISKPHGLDENIIQFILEDILNAIDFLHQKNIIHRAIKGSHILIFGNAKSTIKFVLTGLKYCHQLLTDLKTFNYPENSSEILNHLAPEILEQNVLGYNFKADIYSIGILCCEMANGIVPFDNMESDEILFYKLIGDIPKLLDSTSEEIKIFNEFFDKLDLSTQRRYYVYTRKTFTPLFHEFVHKCLHLEPAQRPTVNEMINDLFLKKMDKENKNNQLLNWIGNWIRSREKNLNSFHK